MNEGPSCPTHGRKEKKRIRADDSSDNSSGNVVRKKRRKRLFSSTPKQGDKSLIATKNGKARVKSRDDYKSRPAHDNVDDFSDSDSDNTHSMVR